MLSKGFYPVGVQPIGVGDEAMIGGVIDVVAVATARQALKELESGK